MTGMIKPGDIDRRIVTLRLTAPVRLHFLHGGVLHGLACRALDVHPLPGGIIPYTGESGRVSYSPGDPYRFGITTVGEGRALLDRFEAGIRRIGAGRRVGGGPEASLQGNFEVVSVSTAAVVAEAAHAALPTDALTLRFLSPLRMQRPQDDVRPGRRYLDGRNFSASQFLERFRGRLERLLGWRDLPPVPPGVGATDAHLLWVDMPIASRDGDDRGRPRGYTLGGVLGSVRLAGLTPPWPQLLMLGSALHAGEKSHYGLGRFVIDEVFEPESDPLRPAQTASARIVDVPLLRSSLEHIVSGSSAAGVDGMRPHEAGLEAEAVVRDLRLELAEGSYKPRELLGFLHSKPSGGVRPLAIPTVRDRCVQRAAMALLGPAVDTLLEDCSYAYRKGFSRAHAAAAVRRAYEQGFRHVLDADIEGFFDAVEWPRMLGKLRALFPWEPLVDLIGGWLAAPVLFEGRRIERTRGLPQGAPISPLLANLFLDEFDEELLGRDYRLVRYADDFVILCRDPAEAERARADARAALAELGLALSEKKTAVTTFDAGFSYLGYLFCRSMILEKDSDAPVGPWQSSETPRHSWLAQLPLRDVRPLERGGTGGTQARAEAVPLTETNPPPAAATRALHLSGPRTRVSRRGELMVVECEDDPANEIRLRDIAHVVLHGPINLTMPALLALGRAGKPVYACRRTGELDVPLVMSRPDWRLWEMQARRSFDAAACREVARSIVQAKLHNTATVVVRLNFRNAPSVAQQLRMAERACSGAADLDALRGQEGRGAALFFAALRDSLPPEWGFRQRLRQPPPDPINAMLSYGYTMLYAHVSTALTGAGLNPDLGFLHRQQDGAHALACDLEEEMRHLVDSLVWAVVQRRELKPSDFGPSEDGRYPCLLSPAARRRFIARFESRMLAEFTPAGESAAVTYREFIWRQAAAMRDFVAGRAACYEPLRIHA